MNIAVAVCRERLPDGLEWSVYFVNGLATDVEVTLERVGFEWGDRGHSTAPRQRTSVAAQASARIWRVNDDDAELSMSLSVHVRTPAQQFRATFELGKLYRYRNPAPLIHVGRSGWLRPPDHLVQL